MATWSDVLQKAHVLVEKDTDYPSSDEEDYGLRVDLGHLAINEWEKTEGVLWNELTGFLSDAADGDTTTVADQAEYDVPSDFSDLLSGTVRVIVSGTAHFYKKVKQGDVQMFANDSVTKICWITGNDSAGKVLHLSPTPTIANGMSGGTINYEYIKNATLPDSAADVVEMSDPYYISYFIAFNELAEDDPELSARYERMAKMKLDNMIAKNDNPIWWEDTTIRDDSAGFGK